MSGSKKRGLPEDFPNGSPKKRLRNSPNYERHVYDEDDMAVDEPAPSLIEARRTLRDTEKDNLSRRVAKMEKTVKKALMSFRNDMTRMKKNDIMEALQNAIENVHFPIKYNVAMAFIESYTGVKKRNKATVCWDDKVSRDWLNRQRATVYGPTLFVEFLDFIDKIAEQIRCADTANSKWLHLAVNRKLLPEVLRAQYKPKSKQAAEKKLICSNAMKGKKFRCRIGKLSGWERICATMTLEMVAHRAEQDYEAMLKAGYGVLDDKMKNFSPNNSEDDDNFFDADTVIEDVNKEDWYGGKRSTTTSHSGSPASSGSCREPPLKSLKCAMSGAPSRPIDVGSVPIPKLNLAGPSLSPPKVQAQPSSTTFLEQLRQCSKEELIHRCVALKVNVEMLADRVQQQERSLKSLHSRRLRASDEFGFVPNPPRVPVFVRPSNVESVGVPGLPLPPLDTRSIFHFPTSANTAEPFGVDSLSYSGESSFGNDSLYGDTMSTFGSTSSVGTPHTTFSDFL